MEKRHSKHGKRMAQIVSGGGGDIGPLLVWGGALAFAGLAAAFAVHNGRRRVSDETSSSRQKQDQTIHGLRNEDSNRGYLGIIHEDDLELDTIKSRNCQSVIEDWSSPSPSYELKNRFENDSVESPLFKANQGTKDKEALDTVNIGDETSSMHLVEENKGNGDDDDQEEEETKEEAVLVIDVEKEEPIEKTSSIHSVKEAENYDKEFGQALDPVERTEVWRKIETFEDAPKASEDITSTMRPVEEEEEHNDEEYAMEERKEDSAVTGSSSIEFNEEEIWPVESVEPLPQELNDNLMNLQYPEANVMEEDQTNKKEERLQSDNSDIKILNNSRHNYQTTKTSKFLKKEETLEFIGSRSTKVLNEMEKLGLADVSASIDGATFIYP